MLYSLISQAARVSHLTQTRGPITAEAIINGEYCTTVVEG